MFKKIGYGLFLGITLKDKWGKDKRLSLLIRAYKILGALTY